MHVLALLICPAAKRQLPGPNLACRGKALLAAWSCRSAPHCDVPDRFRWCCASRAGVTARQRKDELERLNEQLRKINMSLRQQARQPCCMSIIRTDAASTARLARPFASPDYGGQATILTCHWRSWVSTTIEARRKDRPYAGSGGNDIRARPDVRAAGVGRWRRAGRRGDDDAGAIARRVRPHRPEVGSCLHSQSAAMYCVPSTASLD